MLQLAVTLTVNFTLCAVSILDYKFRLTTPIHYTERPKQGARE
jgi:hypothetical protein